MKWGENFQVFFIVLFSNSGGTVVFCWQVYVKHSVLSSQSETPEKVWAQREGMKASANHLVAFLGANAKAHNVNNLYDSIS